jgi:protein CpxP
MKGKILCCMALAMAGVLMAGGRARAQGPDGPGMGPGMMRHEPPFGPNLRFPGMQGRWWNNPKVVATLKLSDGQRKAMDGILYDHREKLIDLQANLERAELAMQPLMSADAPNEGAIDAQIDKIVQARADLERTDARFLLALRMKLTPEQWKQVQAFRADHEADRGPNHEMERRGPMPQRPWRQRPNGQFPPQGPPPPPASGNDGTPGSDGTPAPGNAGPGSGPGAEQ